MTSVMSKIGWVMDFVMTVRTRMTATMMEVTAVVKMSILNFAQNALATKQVCLYTFHIQHVTFKS